VPRRPWPSSPETEVTVDHGDLPTPEGFQQMTIGCDMVPGLSAEAVAERLLSIGAGGPGRGRWAARRAPGAEHHMMTAHSSAEPSPVIRADQCANSSAGNTWRLLMGDRRPCRGPAAVGRSCGSRDHHRDRGRLRRIPRARPGGAGGVPGTEPLRVFKEEVQQRTPNAASVATCPRSSDWR